MRFTRRVGEHGDYFSDSKVVVENKMIISSVTSVRFVCLISPCKNLRALLWDPYIS